MRRLPARRSKFGAVRTEVDGISFASKAEARRWVELQQLQAAGEIRKLRRQVRFELPVNDVLVCRYVADFVYQRKAGAGWDEVVEDVKGVETPEFKLKAKLMQAIYRIGIQIVRPRARA